MPPRGASARARGLADPDKKEIGLETPHAPLEARRLPSLAGPAIRNAAAASTPAGELAAAIPIVLRPYQEHALAELRAAYAAGNRAVLLVLPTGAGKTCVFSYVVALSTRLGKRVLIVAHRRELIKQASAKLTLAGVQHGIIAPGYDSTDDAVQVGSVQTVARRLDRLSQFDFLILDEAHHCVASQYVALIEAMPNARILGVTATPERQDGKGLGIEDGGIFEHMVIGASVTELIECDALCKARYYTPAIGPDLSGARTKMGDYVASDLNAIMSDSAIVGDAIAHYKRLADGHTGIAFCPSVSYAQRFAESCRANDIAAVCVHGKMPVAERDQAMADLKAGKIKVITSCDLIGEGLDVPSVGAVILLRPTQSLGLFLQQIGRGLRPAPGKEHLIVLDHAGNCLRHGFADDPRAWSLAGKAKRKEREQAVSQPVRCPSCGGVHRPARVCPTCHHVYYEAEPRQVEEREGHLVEITDQERRERLARLPLRQVLTGKETRAQLEEIRRARGYKRGWIWYMLQSQQMADAGRGACQ